MRNGSRPLFQWKRRLFCGTVRPCNKFIVDLRLNSSEPVTTSTSSSAQQPSRKGAILRFPAHFLWGVATAPTQIEGHVNNVWTNFTARDGTNCRIACDSYHRYAEDIEWMAQLGVKGYRMGIEWSRLQSEAYAPLNQTELARYIDQL